jgi:hypothetical protein
VEGGGVLEAGGADPAVDADEVALEAADEGRAQVLLEARGQSELGGADVGEEARLHRFCLVLEDRCVPLEAVETARGPETLVRGGNVPVRGHLIIVARPDPPDAHGVEEEVPRLLHPVLEEVHAAAGIAAAAAAAAAGPRARARAPLPRLLLPPEEEGEGDKLGRERRLERDGLDVPVDDAPHKGPEALPPPDVPEQLHLDRVGGAGGDGRARAGRGCGGCAVVGGGDGE